MNATPTDSTTAAPPIRVSVVIPAYNREKTIVAAVNSVLHQSVTDLEVIVVDDGSDDRTVELVTAIADPRLRVLTTGGRCGAPVARNIGIDAAVADLIAFQDSDDLWLPDKLAMQLEAMAADPAPDAVYCKLLQVYEGGPRVVPEHEAEGQGDAFVHRLYEGNFISTQTLIVRKAALKAIDGFDPVLPRLQDWDLVLRLARAGVRFAIVPRPLVLAFETAGNLTSFTMKGVDAREVILRKHADLEPRFRTAAARTYFIMASTCRRGGDHLRARRFARRAVALAPLQPKYVAFLLREMMTPRA